MSVSSSSSPRMASCRWRGVIRLTLRSLAALPASSRTSAVRYSRTAVTYTAAMEVLAGVIWGEGRGGTFGTNTHLVLGVVLEETLYTTAWELDGIGMSVNSNNVAANCWKSAVWFGWFCFHLFTRDWCISHIREWPGYCRLLPLSMHDSSPIAPSHAASSYSMLTMFICLSDSAHGMLLFLLLCRSAIFSRSISITHGNRQDRRTQTKQSETTPPTCCNPAATQGTNQPTNYHHHSIERKCNLKLTCKPAFALWLICVLPSPAFGPAFPPWDFPLPPDIFFWVRCSSVLWVKSFLVCSIAKISDRADSRWIDWLIDCYERKNKKKQEAGAFFFLFSIGFTM